MTMSSIASSTILSQAIPHTVSHTHISDVFRSADAQKQFQLRPITGGNRRSNRSQFPTSMMTSSISAFDFKDTQNQQLNRFANPHSLIRPSSNQFLPVQAQTTDFAVPSSRSLQRTTPNTSTSQSSNSELVKSNTVSSFDKFN